MSGTAPSPQIRITGPYSHREGEYRCRLIIDGCREWGPLADSEQRAKRMAQLMAQRYATIQPLTVGDAIERYRQHLIEKGNKPASYDNTPLRLRRFFGPVLDAAVSSLTERRCRDLYEDLRHLKSPRTERPLSVDTHRAYLAEGRALGGWAVKAKLFKVNPLAQIEGVGRRSNGKPQLRQNEARRLCLLAGVPVVCAHSLRGFHATAAVAAGASPHIVAAALGHESASITLTSYAAPGSAELASRRQAVATPLPAAQ